MVKKALCRRSNLNSLDAASILRLQRIRIQAFHQLLSCLIAAYVCTPEDVCADIRRVPAILEEWLCFVPDSARAFFSAPLLR